MAELSEVRVAAQPIERFVPILGAAEVERAKADAAMLRRLLRGRPVWNVNSTAVGGGVAEMLRPLLAYALGAGVDVRWLVIQGNAEFFRLTKRLHNALHGERGDGSPLGSAERATYEAMLQENTPALCERVERGDVVILHDPQTAGLAPVLAQRGAHVIWRCHIGADRTNEETERGWRFLGPYIASAGWMVFSRAAYVPALVPRERALIIQPSIDPFAAKNRDLPPESVREILTKVGLVDGPPPGAPVHFTRADGSRGEVQHLADVIRLGNTTPWEKPLVVQVSRWDRLKDPIGVLLGFATLARKGRVAEAELVLAGPNVRAVADDPDGAHVLDEVIAAWRKLPHEIRMRVHLASLPTHDVEENAIIVNALQRHAAVVVQKSLREGFGLTVTEAMWKARPVLASRVGGIQDQIVDGESGLLLGDPSDLDAFAALLERPLTDPALAGRLGAAARERARVQFLCLRHLSQYAKPLAALLG